MTKCSKFERTHCFESNCPNPNNFGKPQKSHHPQSPQNPSVCVVCTSSANVVVVFGVIGLSLRCGAWFFFELGLVGLVCAGGVNWDNRAVHAVASNTLWIPGAPSYSLVKLRCTLLALSIRRVLLGRGYAGISGALACFAIFVGLARNYYSSHFFCEDQKPKMKLYIALTTWGKTTYGWGKRLPFRMHTPPTPKNIYMEKAR